MSSDESQRRKPIPAPPRKPLAGKAPPPKPAATDPSNPWDEATIVDPKLQELIKRQEALERAKKPGVSGAEAEGAEESSESESSE